MNQAIRWGDTVEYRGQQFLVTDTDPETRPVGRDLRITGKVDSRWVKSDEVKLIEDCKYNLCNGSGQIEEDGYKTRCLCNEKSDMDDDS